MLKRLTIFFLFAIAYSVLLAHNFTPHHHVAESAGKHHHHHQHETHEHEAESEDKEDTASPFEYFQHTGFSELQYHPEVLVTSVSKKQLKTYSLPATTPIANQHGANTALLLTHRAREESAFISSSLAYFFRLKAPPAIMSA